MSHTSSGVISKPVDNYGDIAHVLGRTTGDEGQLCGDVDAQGVPQNKIKFWSLHKPIQLNKKEELTEADRKSANYGYTITSYDKPVGQAGEGLIYGHLNNLTWQYFKPRGVTYNEPFRKLDFDGYNHGATNPFSISYNTTPKIGDTSRIDMSFLADFLQWGLFEGFAPTFANLYLGLLAFNSSNANPQSCYLLPITSSRSGLTILDIAGNERFSFPVPSSVFSSGTTYTLLPVIMTYDAGNSYGTWVSVNSSTSFLGYFWDILCPDIQITPSSSSPSPGEITVDGVYVDTENAVFSGDDIITIESVPITIYNSTSYQMTSCALYVYFKDYQQATPIVRELGHTSSFSIPANSSSTKTVTGNLSIRAATERIAQGYWQFTYTTNGRTHTIGGDKASDGGRFTLNGDK